MKKTFRSLCGSVQFPTNKWVTLSGVDLLSATFCWSAKKLPIRVTISHSFALPIHHGFAVLPGALM